MTATHPVVAALHEVLKGVDSALTRRQGRSGTVGSPHAADGGPAQPGGHTLYHSRSGWRA